MSADHNAFHYSITCKTDDEAVLFCLRSLCQFCEKHSKPQIGWGGTGSAEWKAAKGTFKLRFTNPLYRKQFIGEGQRLLSGRWSVVQSDDADPASPQRA